MKKYFLIIFMIIISFSSCSLFRTFVSVDDIIVEKNQMDKSENPAQKYLTQRKLRKKSIEINDVAVKNITSSTNIDYDFCVIVDVSTKDGKVECYIYSKNINTISRLSKGKTKINVTGKFSRFFTMLDEYYTKIEIINASIDIIEGKD